MDFGHFAVGVFEGQVDLRSPVGLELDCSVDLASGQKESDDADQADDETGKASSEDGHIQSPQLPETGRHSKPTGKPMQADRANADLTGRVNASLTPWVRLAKEPSKNEGKALWAGPELDCHGVDQPRRHETDQARSGEGQHPGGDDVAGYAPADGRAPLRRAHAHDRGGDGVRRRNGRMPEKRGGVENAGGNRLGDEPSRGVEVDDLRPQSLHDAHSP